MGAFCNGEGTVMGAARDDAAMVLLSEGRSGQTREPGPNLRGRSSLAKISAWNSAPCPMLICRSSPR
jgi:hypothetical protein